MISTFNTDDNQLNQVKSSQIQSVNCIITKFAMEEQSLSYKTDLRDKTFRDKNMIITFEEQHKFSRYNTFIVD